jgi:predicted nucleic acid-binding protein
VSGRTFLDSNVLLYAVSDDSRAPAAQASLQAGHVISVQVLNEFATVARRKLGRSIEEIRQAEKGIRAALEVVPVTVEHHDAALDLMDRYGFSFYDSLIVASALEAGCTKLFTEDLQHGQVLEKRLRVINPFV